jgi:hypothetical protein
VEDWHPPEEISSTKESVPNSEEAIVEEKKSGRSTERQERDAKRLLRAFKKIAHDKLRERKSA